MFERSDIMSRYIEIEKALNTLVDCVAGIIPIALAKHIIEHNSIADVQPVVYGEWIPVKEPDADYNQEYECSKCHKHDVHAISQEVPYCWYCGARMVEE